MTSAGAYFTRFGTVSGMALTSKYSRLCSVNSGAGQVRYEFRDEPAAEKTQLSSPSHPPASYLSRLYSVYCTSKKPLMLADALVFSTFQAAAVFWRPAIEAAVRHRDCYVGSLPGECTPGS